MPIETAAENKQPSTPVYADKRAVAEAFGVSKRTIDAWMARGLIPYYRLHRTIRFRLSDIEAHLNARCKVGGGL